MTTVHNDMKGRISMTVIWPPHKRCKITDFRNLSPCTHWHKMAINLWLTFKTWHMLQQCEIYTDIKEPVQK